MGKALTVLMLSGSLLIGPVAATACSCGGDPDPPLVEYAWADAVFTGTVINITPTSDPDLVDVLMLLTGFWKGVPITPIIHAYTNPSGAACGYNFQVGIEYIVYGKNIATVCCTGPVAFLCTRTRPLSQAQDDIDALGQPGTVGVTHSPWGATKDIYK